MADIAHSYGATIEGNWGMWGIMRDLRRAALVCWTPQPFLHRPQAGKGLCGEDRSGRSGYRGGNGPRRLQAAAEAGL